MSDKKNDLLEAIIAKVAAETGMPKEEIRAMAFKVHEKAKEDIHVCSMAIFDACAKYPQHVALDSIELMLLFFVGQIGEDEMQLMRNHLEAFHTEITLMNMPKTSTDTVQ
jgi:hypothetical protein